MKHFATPAFWNAYANLPLQVRNLADKNYALLTRNPNHASLRFKRLGKYWTVRVGLRYRAIAIDGGDDVVWFWIGSHSDYDKLIR